MARYQALLTFRQQEVLTYCLDAIQTARGIARELTWLNRDFGPPYPQYVEPTSVLQTLYTLERRGLVMRNPGSYYPIEWTATDEGFTAHDLSESGDLLCPTR